MRSRRLFSIGSAFALLACASRPGASDSTSDTSSEGTTGMSTSESSTSGSTTTDTDGSPPLSNGPTGPSMMVLDCAPNDGPAWTFTIGLGSACDMSQPDPALAYVQITAYDYDFLTDPVGKTIEWTDWQVASGFYAPDGQNGMTMPSIAGSLHIETWADFQAIGSTITGWYTMSFEAGDEIGASFEATYCGGMPACG